MRKENLFLLLFLSASTLLAQNRNPFNSYLPIMDLPSLDWSSPMNEKEPIVFNVSPSLYYQFFNSYDKTRRKVKQQAFYANFRMHIRMFQSESLPVRTPSYKFFFGYQRTFPIGDKQLHFALETGHYSNGQSNCAWGANLKDGSEACETAYNSMTQEDVLSNMLNRNSGNFSTNLSKVSLEYVIPPIAPEKLKNRAIAHRFRISYQQNHEGFAYVFDFDEGMGDIPFIGNQIVSFSTESFFSVFQSFDVSLKNEVEYVSGAHSSINPWRYQLSLNVFPSDWITAFFIAYTSGHDNYNYRIVDSRNQVSLGVRWDLMNRELYKQYQNE